MATSRKLTNRTKIFKSSHQLSNLYFTPEFVCDGFCYFFCLFIVFCSDADYRIFVEFSVFVEFVWLLFLVDSGFLHASHLWRSVGERLFSLRNLRTCLAVWLMLFPCVSRYSLSFSVSFRLVLTDGSSWLYLDVSTSPPSMYISSSPFVSVFCFVF